MEGPEKPKRRNLVTRVSVQSCVGATPSRNAVHFIEISDTEAVEISDFQEALCSEFIPVPDFSRLSRKMLFARILLLVRDPLICAVGSVENIFNYQQQPQKCSTKPLNQTPQQMTSF